MRDQGTGGSLVLIASIASHMALPLQRLSMYGATKGAVRVLMTQLAVELGPYNIRVVRKPIIESLCQVAACLNDTSCCLS
jgi:NAD(P)-dependent dehydrogenase (short-subunit alcohol dehydrogenase family)